MKVELLFLRNTFYSWRFASCRDANSSSCLKIQPSKQSDEEKTEVFITHKVIFTFFHSLQLWWLTNSHQHQKQQNQTPKQPELTRHSPHGFISITASESEQLIKHNHISLKHFQTPPVLDFFQCKQTDDSLWRSPSYISCFRAASLQDASCQNFRDSV